MRTALNKSNLSLKAIEVCQILQDNGYESYLVGGCVRDLIMDNPPKDWDICTNALPEQVKTIFPKTYDTGLQHGTITVNMGSGATDSFEVTTYRTEGTYTDGRRPDSVAFVTSIEEDLARRDLTINAIAYDPIKDRVVDPYGGLKDINNEFIRAVGDPNMRFAEDGLRTMRVARFAARFGFRVDIATQIAISNNLEVLAKVSKERMRDELSKTLMTKCPSIGLNILLISGALEVLGSVFKNPAIAQVDFSHGNLETKLAVLLHETPKAELEAALRDLKFTNVEIRRVVFLNTALSEFGKFNQEPSALAARKFLSFVKNDSPADFDRSLEEFLDLAQALSARGLNSLQKLLTEKSFARRDLLISGNDLMENLSMQPGPDIKRILDHLYREVISNPELNEKDKLLEMAKNLLVA